MGAKKGFTEQEITINLKHAKIQGTLSLPSECSGIVFFAHGSGSSRHSPRNQYVAKVLQDDNIATLLMDLFTEEEELVDQTTQRAPL